MTNAGCEGCSVPAASAGKFSYLNVFNSNVTSLPCGPRFNMTVVPICPYINAHIDVRVCLFF